MSRRGGRKGFSLIEALVALAIASVCLLVLFGLQRQLVSSQRRFETAVRRAEGRRNVLALVRDLNPEAQPEGVAALPDGESLQWTSRPASPLRPALTLAGSPGAWLVRLHLIHARLTDARGVVEGEVSVERMGWRPALRAGRPPPAGALPPPSAP